MTREAPSSAAERDDVLPEALALHWDGTGLEAKVGLASQLLVNGPDGSPRAAMLSVGEVLALAPARLAIALYPRSGTSLALREQGRAVLLAVVDRHAYKVHVAVERVLEPSARLPQAVFDTRVVQARKDAVGYAVVTDGLRYSLIDVDPVLSRWRSTLASLRSLAPPDARV